MEEELGPTFRFIPGVASTSLAVGTARRLGVTFDELEQILEKRIDCGGRSSDEIDQLAHGDGRE